MTVQVRIEEGDVVIVHYFGYDVVAVVLPTEKLDRERGWVMVEQITDYEDYDLKPSFLALASEMTVPA